MKRGAEKQLSKDDNPDDEAEEVQTGFQAAKESELAKREIRGLPKRRSPTVALVSPPGTTQPGVPQKFGSFSGFGASTGGATSFTFASSPPGGSPQKPADAPTVSESASNATKKFASFLGPPPTAGTKPLVSSSETSKQDASSDIDEVALKYYTSLRGLNSCFLSTISKAIESDPFVDIADLLEQYKKHRVSVQQDYDGKSSRTSTQSVPNPTSKPPVPPAPISSLKPPGSTLATMPVPPSGFSGFGVFSDSTAPATGFTPSPAPTANPAPFSLSSTSPASSDAKPVSAASSPSFPAFGPVSSRSPFKPAASHTSKEAKSNTPSLNPPSFGAFAPTSASNAFSFGGSSSGSTSLPNSSTLLFGNPPKSSTLFSSDKVVPQEKDKEKDKPASSAPPPGPFAFSLAPGANLFGNASTSLSGSSNIFGATTTTMKSADEHDNKDNREKDKPVVATPPTSVFGGAPFGVPSKSSPFSFAASATTPAQFGFGIAPGGSKGSSPPPPKAGNVGFSFGSPPRTSLQATTSTSNPGSVFGFGSTSAAGPAAPAGVTANSTPTSTNASTPAPASAVPTLLEPSSSAASRSDTPATEGSLEEEGLARTQSPGLHGEEGEGEEDEETTYTIKSKVFKFTTDREGVPTWSDMGIGMLRLKRHKESEARRVILRSNTTGKIIINFRIYPGLQPKRTGKTVAFTGHITSPGNDTQSVQYRLRVASEANATELVEAMEREVRLVQTNSGPST